MCRKDPQRDYLVRAVLTSGFIAAVNFADIYRLFARIFLDMAETNGRCCGYHV